MKNGFYFLNRVPTSGHKLYHRAKFPDKCQAINNPEIRENLSKYFSSIVLSIDQQGVWQERVMFTCQSIIEALNNRRLCQCAVIDKIWFGAAKSIPSALLSKSLS